MSDHTIRKIAAIFLAIVAVLAVYGVLAALGVLPALPWSALA